MAKRVSSSAQYSPEMVQKLPPLKENDLVWIIDHREKRGFYRLARVKKCYFGNDGHIRSFNEPYFHNVLQNDFWIGGDQHFLTRSTNLGQKTRN